MKNNSKLERLAKLRKQAEESLAKDPTATKTNTTDKKKKLIRTSITLKNDDQESIKTLLSFFIQNDIHQLSTSSVIQIALQFTAKNANKLEDEIIETYKNVLNEDGRRHAGE